MRALALMACLSASLASAEPRIAVVATLTADGKADDPKALEALLAQALSKSARVVDAQRVQAVRAALLETAPKGLSSLDAEWLLRADAVCKTLQTKLQSGETIHAGNCDVTLTLTALDTGDRAASASVFGKGPAATPREAVRRALEKAAQDFAAQKLETFVSAAAQPRPVAIWLFGAPDRATAEAVRAGLERLGVKSASLTDFAPEVCRLEVTLDGGGVELAAAIDDSNGDLLVRVERASQRRLTLRFDPTRPLRLRFEVKPFADRTGKKADAHLAREATDAVGTLLVAEGWLIPAGSATAALTVTGSVGPKSFAVTATSGKQKAVGAGKTLADATAALLKQLAERRPGVPKTLDAGRKARPLELTKWEAPAIYPAKLSRYAAGEPVATLTVRSRSFWPVDGVTARAELDGFSLGPAPMPVATAGPQAPITLKVPVALDGQRLLAVRQSTVAQLKVELSWKQGDAERSDTFVLPVTVLERNAIDWSDTAMAAAFISPRDPTVQKLAAEALRGEQPALGLPRAVVRAARVVELLRAQKLSYAPDPVVPFGQGSVDFVSFPAETLDRHVGDCDDLAVLLASTLEAAGVATRLVTTPGHVLVAYDSGLPTSAALRDVVQLDGRVWLPLEATALGKGYETAAAEGQREVQRHANQLQHVAVREAWARYPPAPPPPSEAKGSAVAALQTVPLDEWVQKLAAARSGALKVRVGELDKKLAAAPKDAALTTEKAVLLALLGQLDDAAAVAAPLRESNDAAALALANIRALKGELEEAERGYAEALPRASASTAGAMRFNAAVVKLLRGDEAGAADALMRALEQDPSVARQLMPVADGVRGDDPMLMPLDSQLTALLMLAQKKLAAADGGTAVAPQAYVPSAGRRGADPDARKGLAEVLRWP